MKKKVGADLYISIIRKDDTKFVSKGLLVQAKWDDTVRASDDQAKKMIEISSDASYVWVYGPRSIDVIPARTIAEGLSPPPPQEQPTVGELIASGIECHAGDPGIGRLVEGDRIEPLNTAMERLGTPVGMGFKVSRREH